MAPPRQCFISYAHADHGGFDRLRVHLTAVAHLYGFTLWHDRRILPGHYWNARIRDAIADSQIFVLLTSSDFLASDYILHDELPAILRRHKADNALVLPVIYRRCGWKGFFGNYIQATPTTPKGELRPVMDWPRPENGFAAAAEAAGAAVGDWFGVPPVSPMAALAP